MRARYGLYLPPVDRPAIVARAGAFERAGRVLGPLGAAFVAVRAEQAAPEEGPRWSKFAIL